MSGYPKHRYSFIWPFESYDKYQSFMNWLICDTLIILIKIKLLRIRKQILVCHFQLTVYPHRLQKLIASTLGYFYAPNFGKVEGAYCFGLVHLSKQILREGFEIS